jgi:hypothetical protein
MLPDKHVDSPLVNEGAETAKPGLKPFTSNSVAHKGLSSDDGKVCGGWVGQNLKPASFEVRKGGAVSGLLIEQQVSMNELK